MLTLTRKLVTLDVETHDSCEPEDARIVELSIIVLHPDNQRETFSWLLNPEVEISAGAEETHGISNAAVADELKFIDIADKVLSICSDCDFCGYYVRYDLRVLGAEFRRAGHLWSRGDACIIDPHRLWQIAQPRRLEDAVREFLQHEPAAAHRATDDVENTFAVLNAQLKRFSVLPKTVKELHHLSFGDMIDLDQRFVWRDNEAVFNFGTHKNTKLRDADPNYLTWMLRQNFSAEVKQLVLNALSRKYPERETAWKAPSSDS